MTDATKLSITKEVLEEMAKDATVLRLTPKAYELPYEQAQQVLTISTLIRWIESFGIEAPFKIDL